MDEKAVVETAGEKVEEEQLVEEQPVEVIQPEFEIRVTADHLSVYVRLANNGVSSDVTVEEAEVFTLLEKNGIKYGIVPEEVKEFCVRKNYFQWHKVSFGTHAVDGEDGSYTLTFNADAEAPKERDDGTIDYKELGLIKNVFEGEVLCNIVLPTPGVDGINVYGGAVSARDGKAAKVEAGNNVSLTDDGTEILADKDGCVYFKQGKVYIEEVYSVKEDVDLKTGNVEFNGSITVFGSVLQGFKVTAQKDILIKGRVEGAELTAGGNIVIVGGVAGMSLAKIDAEGDISAKFIESANVHCGGNLTSDIILMSNVKVEKSIFLKGDKGAIIGGSTLAGESIVASNIGSPKHLAQDVTVRKNWKFYEQNEEDQAEQQAEQHEKEKKDKKSKEELTKKLASVEEYIETFSKKIKEENALGANKSIAALKEYMVKKSELSAVAASLKNMLTNFKEEDFMSSITCKQYMYPGVRLRIDNCFMDIETEIQNQKFYVNEGEIVLGAVLPGGEGES